MSPLIPLEHPGIILKEEFLDELELTPYAVSKATGISQTALSEILKGKRGISPKNALKLSKYFEMSDSFFINLQTRYSLELTKESNKSSLAKIIPFRQKSTYSQELYEA
ncbi:MAG: HigA family addiction module antitoxin [Desulfotalea sp.]